MNKNNQSKYVLCMNEEASYLRINLEEIDSLKLEDYFFNYAVKDDKYFYIHADCMSDIGNCMKKQGKTLNPIIIMFEDLSFLNNTEKYNNQDKSKIKI